MKRNILILMSLLLVIPMVVMGIIRSKPFKLWYYSLVRPNIVFDNSDRCGDELKTMGLSLIPQKDFRTDEGCGFENVLKFRQLTIPQNQVIALTCQMTLALVKFEQDVLQPAASKFFQQKIQKIENFGTYNCRKQRKSRFFLSEHARANAIDIGGFYLEDGTVISVLKHWSNAGKKSEFLREVSHGACEYFSKVLTPNFDKLHKDHFHLDMSFWPRCHD
ncbi:MAG: extensin family protein [SAR324 cluster bacterium]|nr:extensin family protein [SAR324 cluster bacterium]